MFSIPLSRFITQGELRLTLGNQIIIISSISNKKYYQYVILYMCYENKEIFIIILKTSGYNRRTSVVYRYYEAFH